MTATKKAGAIFIQSKGALARICRAPTPRRAREKRFFVRGMGRLGNAGALGELRGITVLSTKGRNNRGQKETGLFIFPGMAEEGGLTNRRDWKKRPLRKGMSGPDNSPRGTRG